MTAAAFALARDIHCECRLPPRLEMNGNRHSTRTRFTCSDRAFHARAPPDAVQSLITYSYRAPPHFFGKLVAASCALLSAYLENIREVRFKVERHFHIERPFAVIVQRDLVATDHVCQKL